MKKIILVILIFVLSCPAKGQDLAAEPINEFWTWFIKNEKDLRNFEKDPDRYLNKIARQINKVQDGLAIELGTPKDGLIEMTISADGVATLFPVVIKIVEKAPELKGWKFYAFRQRQPKEKIKEFTLSNGANELNVGDLKFYPIEEDDALDIIIFVNGLTEENRNQIAYAGLLLLDNILGEYDCVTKVRHYDFQPMPEDQSEKEDLLPLSEIADFVDKFGAK
jgi:hypothetical protein